MLSEWVVINNSFEASPSGASSGAVSKNLSRSLPGKVEKIEFELPDIYHAFRRGHRVMVHVQSSWFPLVDRNPQKFLKISEARAEDFQKATQRIYRSGRYTSSVQLPVLE